MDVSFSVVARLGEKTLTRRSYPLYVNVWNRDVMDVHRSTMVGVQPVSDKEMQLEGQTSRADDGKPTPREVE